MTGRSGTDVRYAPNSRQKADIARGRLRADCVAKVETCRVMSSSRERKTGSNCLFEIGATALSEVTCEFNDNRCGPSHLYSLAAISAFRIHCSSAQNEFCNTIGQKAT